MKKLVSLLLACAMLLCLTACGAKDQDEGNSTPPAATEPLVSDGAPETALALLEAVWATYSEDEQFPSAGGDFSEGNSTMGAPGKFEDKNEFDNTLAVPSNVVSMIQDAASLVHMMNANTFTCGAFKTASSEDAEALSSAVMDNVMGRQWICGFPDKLVIIQVGNYVISAFGSEDLIDTFAAKVQGVYGSAKVVVDEAINVG